MRWEGGFYHGYSQARGEAGGQAGQEHLEHPHQRHGLRHPQQCSGQAHWGEGGVGSDG